MSGPSSSGAIWSPENLPSQAGKTIIVTGANAGIGYETASILAGKGANVILACRTPSKAEAALRQILSVHPGANVATAKLDLSSLASVRAFADDFVRDHQRLDVLINNAGVMTPPFGRTADGFETQFGTNFIGHFLLTVLLLPLLNQTPSARVVTLSSVAHWVGRIDFENLNAEKGYSKIGAYAQSKLANLIFVYELQRRLDAAGASTISVGAHPGVTASELTRHDRFLNMIQRVASQSTVQGAMPSLRAAIDPDVRGGDYFGPGGLLSLSLYGDARKQRSSRRSRDPAIAARLWKVGEQLSL